MAKATRTSQSLRGSGLWLQAKVPEKKEGDKVVVAIPSWFRSLASKQKIMNTSVKKSKSQSLRGSGLWLHFLEYEEWEDSIVAIPSWFRSLASKAARWK